MVTLLQHCLQIGAATNDDSADVGSVVGNEMLSNHFRALYDVKVALLLAQSGESESRLTTTTVLFGQLHRHTLQDFFIVTLQGREENAITVNDDETKLVVIRKQGKQGLRVKAILALVGENVDWAVGLKCYRYFLFGLTVLHHDDTTEDAETACRRVFVELQFLA